MSEFRTIYKRKFHHQRIASMTSDQSIHAQTPSPRKDNNVEHTDYTNTRKNKSNRIFTRIRIRKHNKPTEYIQTDMRTRRNRK